MWGHRDSTDGRPFPSPSAAQRTRTKAVAGRGWGRPGPGRWSPIPQLGEGGQRVGMSSQFLPWGIDPIKCEKIAGDTG